MLIGQASVSDAGRLSNLMLIGRPSVSDAGDLVPSVSDARGLVPSVSDAGYFEHLNGRQFVSCVVEYSGRRTVQALVDQVPTPPRGLTYAGSQVLLGRNRPIGRKRQYGVRRTGGRCAAQMTWRCASCVKAKM